MLWTAALVAESANRQALLFLALWTYIVYMLEFQVKMIHMNHLIRPAIF
ncbi:hypothetical protein ACLMAB_14410 [Brevibacillus laterosporus]